MAEIVIGADHIPGLGARLHGGFRESLGSGERVAAPLHRVRIALAHVEGGCGAVARQEHLFSLVRGGGDRQRYARTDDVDNGADVFLIVPASRDRASNVRLVLMIGCQYFNRPPQDLAAHILNRELHGYRGALARRALIDARHVGEDADLDRSSRSVLSHSCGS
jgi:hypothetical protein